uniref:Uncharacterized protein n=1 Tax=Meloidogyne hapla TaxID=6305 RepID=A0A1I8BH76_MELHA
MNKKLVNSTIANRLALFILLNKILVNLCVINGIDKLNDKGKSIATEPEASKAKHLKLNPFAEIYHQKAKKVNEESTSIDKQKENDKNEGNKLKTWADITAVKKTEIYTTAFIKDKAECFYDYGWDDEECTLVNEAKEDKATNMDDADLDWEQKADREFDWKIENKNAVQT